MRNNFKGKYLTFQVSTLKTKLFLYSLDSGLSVTMNGFLRNYILNGCKNTILALAELSGGMLYYRSNYLVTSITYFRPLIAKRMLIRLIIFEMK